MQFPWNVILHNSTVGMSDIMAHVGLHMKADDIGPLESHPHQRIPTNFTIARRIRNCNPTIILGVAE